MTEYDKGLNHGLELAQVYIDATLKYGDNEDPKLIRILTRMKYHLENLKQNETDSSRMVRR